MKKILLLIGFIASFSTEAAPWVDIKDISLRADLQFLADSHVINIPVTSYPLMWASINTSIKGTNLKTLSNAQKSAIDHVKRAMKAATTTGFKNQFKLYATSTERQFNSHELNYPEKSNLTISSQYINQQFSGKIQVNHHFSNPLNNSDDKTNFDESYLAYKLGNWVLTLGSLEQSWGPGLDSSLILSNNARPLPAFSIRRNDSRAFKTPWLSWIGPWTFVAQMAQLEEERHVPNAKLWSTRATFKPYKKLELGLSWSYQWGGDGQPNSSRFFFNGLLGQTECVNEESSCDKSLQTKLGNHLAGLDLRWSDTFSGQPYAIYAQTIGEDSSGPSVFQISDKSFLYGLETHLTIAQQRIWINLEYSDTQANCGPRGDTSQDCFYEHGTYQSGYRFYQRSIGSKYDNDAETYALTIFSQLSSGNQWQLILRNLDLNTNDRDRYPNNSSLGNSVSKVFKQINQIDMQYQFDLFDGRLTVGALVDDVKIQDDESEIEYGLYFNFTY